MVVLQLPWVPEPKNNKKKKFVLSSYQISSYKISAFPLTNFLSFKFWGSGTQGILQQKLLFVEPSDEDLIMVYTKPVHFLKKGLDRASKSGRFVKENKSMTPALGITMLAVAKICFGFQNTFQRKLFSNELATI